LKLGVKCFYQHPPWLKHELAVLGVRSDKEVARLTGHSALAVEAKRQQLKIPPANPVVRRWSKEEITLLGVISDRELAGRLNCPVRAVAHKRRRLGLVPCVCRR
jgi:hypothetical protein